VSRKTKDKFADFSSAMMSMAISLDEQLACIIFFKDKCRACHRTAEALALEKND
jgi:hypothetical protein